LVSSICYKAGFLEKGATTVLEQLKITSSAVTKNCRQNFYFVQVSHQLCFLGVALFLTTCKSVLSFFGHLIGCSVASTSTISITVSLGCSAFFLEDETAWIGEHIFHFLDRAAYCGLTDTIC